MAFKTRIAAQPAHASPEEHHRNLPKGPGAVQNLWTHQSDVLRAYVEKCQDNSDVALELPTGTGKTLPGLLLAEWTMRQKQGRVIYACPTRQLARQVHGVATREGIQAALFIGNNQYWDNEASASFAAAKQIAITTYSSIFNSSPKFQPPDTIVFDDAHAGEQYVAGAYSLLVERHTAEEAYQAILSAVGPALDGVYRERLRDPGNSAGIDNDIRLVIPAQDVRMQESLESTLSTVLTGSHWHQFAMIRRDLASCLIFLNARSVLVRPLVPPTYQNSIFSEASQRIYLSATLGQGGELERAFGRSPIARILLPESSPAPRSGRRLFVFADLVKDASPDEVSESITSEIGKALILTPDRAASEKLANILKQDGWPVYTNDHVETHLEDFKSSNRGICALASRFDGIDFPDDTCRLVVQEGLPDNTTHMESFLSGRARAGLALAERVRTRVVQASGRCTRGPSDYAVVVVRGSNLTNYYLAPENLRHLDAEVQAEIQFGYDNSRASSSELLENVRLFIGRKPDWFEVAEPDIIERRQEIESLEVVGAEALAVAAVLEIEACSEASAGRWQQASSLMERAANKGIDIRSYPRRG